MLITNLGYYNIILGQPWIKKHKVLINTTNKDIIFWNGFYKY